MVLGCFANFAQNEYGLDMLHGSELFIGLIFLVESFYYFKKNISVSKTKAFYLFAEHFWLGIIFLGYFFKSMHWPGGGIALTLGPLFIFVIYFTYAIRVLIKEPKKGQLLAVLVFLFVITTICSVIGLNFKIQHLPGSVILMRISFFAVMIFIITGLIKRRYHYSGEMISLKERIMKLPGKMRMAFAYFTIWIIYIWFIVLKVTPDFYTLSVPPAKEKLKQEQSAAEGVYWHNYENFMENRYKAENK